MKRSAPLQFLAVVATDTTTVMASRTPYRGGRKQWGRGFSDRPYNNWRGHQHQQFVTGDSHFQSVRDANFTFRQGASVNSRPSTRPQQNQQFHQPTTPPRFNPNPQFRRPPPIDPNQGFRPPQQFRPRPPKPLDYREWQYSKAPPPPYAERFTVLSYNILADYLALDHRNKLYYHIPRWIMDWEWRKKSILFELGLWSADIMCFQEVDRFRELEEDLKQRGYSGIWKMRTGNAVDGCAIFWRTSRFKLVYEDSIEFIKFGLRDNVAQICVLELANQNNTADKNSSQHTGPAGSNKVVICNIHVLYNPKRGEIKLGQVKMLLYRAHAVSKLWNDAPVVLCGDFNSTPKSPLYNFISEQKLDIAGLDRDKVSGQASAEIRTPQQHNAGWVPNKGEEFKSADNKIQVPAVEGKKLDVSLSDTEKHNNPDKHGDSSQPQCARVVSDTSDTSCNPQHVNFGSSLNVDKTEESLEDVKDCSKNEAGSSTSVSIDCHKENSFICNSQDEFQLDRMHAVSNNAQHNEKENSAFSNQRFLCKEFQSNVDVEDIRNNFNDLALHFEASPPEKSEVVSSQLVTDAENSNLSNSESHRDISTASTSIYNVDDNPEVAVPSGESNKLFEEEGITGEDESTFLAALNGHDSNDFLSRSPGDEALDGFDGNLDSEIVNVQKTTYDPSLWTPMEIASATGNADCTLMEHPLKLKSTYVEVKDNSGTRDPTGEPIVTSYNRSFIGTVDYIWCSESLQTVRVLAPIPKHAMQWTPGFPTKKWGSDHIALASELAFTKCSSDNSD